MNQKNVIIFGSYLAILAVIILAVKLFGLNTKVGLWTALITACVYAALWPRWGK